MAVRLVNPKYFVGRSMSSDTDAPCHRAGAQGVAHGRAVHSDGLVCDGRNASAAGIPLPRLTVRH